MPTPTLVGAESDRRREQRWQTFGLVGGVVLLMVVHTVHEDDEHGQSIEVIRIILARRADRTEKQRDEEQNR